MLRVHGDWELRLRAERVEAALRARKPLLLEDIRAAVRAFQDFKIIDDPIDHQLEALSYAMHSIGRAARSVQDKLVARHVVAFGTPAPKFVESAEFMRTMQAVARAKRR